MIVLPCSMGTLASIANGLAETLVTRAADVTLKERRPLILCVRETPFNRIHLRNMQLASDAGAVIFPVIPAFYNRPVDSNEMARQFVCRVLAHIGLSAEGQPTFGSRTSELFSRHQRGLAARARVGSVEKAGDLRAKILGAALRGKVAAARRENKARLRDEHVDGLAFAQRRDAIELTPKDQYRHLQRRQIVVHDVFCGRASRPTARLTTQA